MWKELEYLLGREQLNFHPHLTLDPIFLHDGRTLGLVKEEEVATLMEMRLWSPPRSDHKLVELLVELQTIPRQRDIAGDPILLAHPAHTHGSGGAAIGGVALDDEKAP
jgi:hypothetical protein